MPRLAGVVSVSQSLLDNLAAAGITHDNTEVIPTGVDVAAFAPGATDPHLLLAVGRIVAKKAPLIVLEAFASVAPEFPAHRLEIIGDGDLEFIDRVGRAHFGRVLSLDGRTGSCVLDLDTLREGQQTDVIFLR
jgi:glycosyltransferase involved in cell wall biosynthesis